MLADIQRLPQAGRIPRSSQGLRKDLCPRPVQRRMLFGRWIGQIRDGRIRLCDNSSDPEPAHPENLAYDLLECIHELRLSKTVRSRKILVSGIHHVAYVIRIASI